MKIKSFFCAVATVAIGALMLVSCGGGGGTQTATDQIYHYGNCKKSNVHSGLIGIGTKSDLATATLIEVDKISMVGTHIVGYRMLIGGNNPTNTSIFLGEDYQNPTYTQDFTYQKGGWNVVMLNEAMEIPEKDFYVGYKITDDGYCLGGEEAKSRDTEMICIDGKWDPIASVYKGFLWSIQLLVTGGDYSAYVQKDLVLENVSSPDACRGGNVLKLKAEVRNQGVYTAEGAVVKATFGGQTVEHKIDGKIVHGQTAVVEFDVNCPNATGIQDLAINVEWVSDEDNVKNNSVSKSVMVYSSDAPNRVAVLLEQFTGQDCGNCPNGAEVLAGAIADLSPENQEKVIWVAHHSGYYDDVFTIQECKDIASSLGVNFAPALTVNRTSMDYGEGVSELVWHPANTTTTMLENLIAEPASATIEMTRTFDADTKAISVTVSGTAYNADQYLTVLVKQSGFVARQSGGGNNYVHNNVPRYYLTAAKGDKLTVDADGNYTVTIDKVLPEKVGDFDTDPAQMEVVAFVHGAIGKAGIRAVANAIELPLVEAQAAPAFVRYQEMINSFMPETESRISLSTDRFQVSRF